MWLGRVVPKKAERDCEQYQDRYHPHGQTNQESFADWRAETCLAVNPRLSNRTEGAENAKHDQTAHR
jgi:hypothetical protein